MPREWSTDGGETEMNVTKRTSTIVLSIRTKREPVSTATTPTNLRNAHQMIYEPQTDDETLLKFLINSDKVRR